MSSPTCFVCDKPLGSTYINAVTYPEVTVPAMCVRCGARVHGIIHAIRDPLVAILKEVEWASGDDLTGATCVECGNPRDDDDDDGHDHKNPAPHDPDCRLAAAIGATRHPPPKGATDG